MCLSLSHSFTQFSSRESLPNRFIHGNDLTFHFISFCWPSNSNSNTMCSLHDTLSSVCNSFSVSFCFWLDLISLFLSLSSVPFPFLLLLFELVWFLFINIVSPDGHKHVLQLDRQDQLKLLLVIILFLKFRLTLFAAFGCPCIQNAVFLV